ncbi:MAG: DegT/DnrJ/EryC1/StrS family aminotransferase [Bacteroidaceae bacterium]|nr:DegT/DnrJ/EryC1/StrS family aminotransferase [Bacteroidaceae bacterium]
MEVNFLDLKSVTALHDTEIKEAISRVVDSGWYLQGEETKCFEKNYADYIGTKYCIGVGNGLDALTLILRAYKEIGRLHDGDEIIVPANTFIATILAITDNNLVPVFAEPRLDTLVIDDSAIETLITERTRAIMIVHLYGRCAYTEKIYDLCKSYNLLLLEDNAQAHGCCWKTNEQILKKTGSLGDAAAHSFYPGKNLGAFGDAGAVTTDDENLANAIHSLSNYGSTAKYYYKYKGRNSRLDEIQAAVLDVKLKYLDGDNKHRQMIADYYYENISNSCVILPKRLPHTNNVYHLFPVLSDRRDELQSFLQNKGVHSLIHYPVPAHRQDCYKEFETLSLPITDIISKQELSIPMGPALNFDEAKYVVEQINLFA